MKKNPRIIFMGNSDFSVFSLEKLLNYKYNIVSVVTTPDKRIGRGQKISQSKVKKFSIIHKIEILQPNNLKDISFLNILRSFKPEIIIIVDFRILPKNVWSIPKLGTFNLHASLLPNYRGAAPIQWAIINGEKETGVTTFFLDQYIDNGPILLQKKILILPEENFGSLYNRLAKIGSELVIKTLKGIIKNELKPKYQIIKKNLKVAPKIFSKDRKINWKLPMHIIYNKIRGLSPYPGAWTQLINKSLGKKTFFKIYKISFFYQLHSYLEGTIIIKNKKMKVALKKGYIYIIEGQLEGKKRMKIDELINGLKEKNFVVF